MECLNYAANIRVLPHSTSGCEHLLWMMLTWVGMIIGNYTVHTLISPGYMRPSWEQCRSFSQNSDKYGLTRQLWMPSLAVTLQNEQYERSVVCFNCCCIRPHLQSYARSGLWTFVFSDKSSLSITAIQSYLVQDLVSWSRDQSEWDVVTRVTQ